MPQRVRTREEVRPIWMTSVSRECRGFMRLEVWTYQEDNGYVEAECYHGVGEEGEQADVVDVLHVQMWDLHHGRHAKVHDGAYGGEVVKRHQGVHLVLGRTQ